MSPIKLFELLTAMPWKQVLAWCLPLALILAALILVLIFANKDVVNVVMTALFAGGSFAAGRLTR